MGGSSLLGSATGFPTISATNPANTRSCPTGLVHYEPMFVQMKQIPVRAADMIDLAIEFSTLGEYGLEYPEETTPGPCRGTLPACEQADHQSGSTLRESRTGKRPARSSRPRVRTGDPKTARTRYTHAGTSMRSSRPAANSGLPEALRPPRIELSFN